MNRLQLSHLLISLILLIPLCQRAESKVVIIVSANAEWSALLNILKPDSADIRKTPYGSWFQTNQNSIEIGGKNLIFLQGGWGKIDAAASAQWAILTWHPERIINIGTAGGFLGRVKEEEIVFAEKTIVYDIIERMGNSQEAIDSYTTRIGQAPPEIAHQVRSGTILSADQDLDPAHLKNLMKTYDALAADWESASIARVCIKNQTKIWILRGISDVVYPSGSRTYGNIKDFQTQTEKVMKKLIILLQNIR